MITLVAHDLRWIGGAHDEEDQCAYGRVQFGIDETSFVSTDDGAWTLSAAALFLLRTLEHDHTATEPVAESSQLFPC